MCCSAPQHHMNIQGYLLVGFYWSIMNRFDCFFLETMTMTMTKTMTIPNTKKLIHTNNSRCQMPDGMGDQFWRWIFFGRRYLPAVHKGPVEMHTSTAISAGRVYDGRPKSTTTPTTPSYATYRYRSMQVLLGASVVCNTLTHCSVVCHGNGN
jgi:hypothetical protein